MQAPAFRAAALAGAVFVATCALPRLGLLTAELDTSLFQQFGDAVTAGRIPYRDFSVEYPPGALPAFVVPSLFPGGAYGAAFKGLELVYGVVAVACVGVGAAALGLRGRLLYASAVLAGLAPFLLGPVSLLRFDLWPAALTGIALAALLTDRMRLGSAALAAAATAKLYPLALAPLAFLYIRRRAGPDTARRAAVVFAVTGLAVLAPFVLLGPGGVASSLQRQAGRGLEIESLGAGALLVAHQLGAYTATVVPASGSFDLQGALPDAFAAAESILLAAVVTALVVLFARSDRGRAELVLASATVVTFAVLLGKVLSPQFLLWLVPLVPLLAGETSLATWVLFPAALVLTHLVYPGRHEALVDLEALPAWLLFARNAVLAALATALVLALAKRSRGARPAVRARRSGRRASRSPSRSAVAPRG
jgi:Glycosyltransferase family 87